MDDSGRNPSQWWPGDSAGSLWIDSGGNEGILQSSTTPPDSVPHSHSQSLQGEPWQEPEQIVHSDLEDHRRDAFSSGPSESVENATRSTNSDLSLPPLPDYLLNSIIERFRDVREIAQLSPRPLNGNAHAHADAESMKNAISSTNSDSGSQFREVDLNGNAHAESSEWLNFLAAADDGGVAPAPGFETLGMCSSATHGASPTRNHTPSAKTAQNPKLRCRNRNKIDGVKNSKTGRRHRGPNWSSPETQWFLRFMEVEVQKRKPPWKAISDNLKAKGFVREPKACEDHYGVLLADLRKFENHFGTDNILRDRQLWPHVSTMSPEQRSQNGLPLVFEEVWFEALARIVKERSHNGCKHRESRREHCLKGRIHDVAEPPPPSSPSSSSRRQQSRVGAASATPSSEIFDNPVGDGDGIGGLVELLGSNDQNGTVDQIFEARRNKLEAQKMDLRRQELELERDRKYAYQGQRNRLAEKVRLRPPPAAHEWN